MHAVIETKRFLDDCAESLTDEERLAIVNAYALDPKQGDLSANAGSLAVARTRAAASVW